VCNDTPDGGFRERHPELPTVAVWPAGGPRNLPEPRGPTTTRPGRPVLSAEKDKLLYLEPGFTLGGPILKNRLWFFTSYIPTLDRMSRTVNFTGPNPGLRTFYRSNNNSETGSRGWTISPSTQLRLYAGWQYGYSRIVGQLPNFPIR